MLFFLLFLSLSLLQLLLRAFGNCTVIKARGPNGGIKQTRKQTREVRDTIYCPPPPEKMEFNIYGSDIIGRWFVCGLVLLRASLRLANISPVCLQSCPFAGLRGQLVLVSLFHYSCAMFSFRLIRAALEKSFNNFIPKSTSWNTEDVWLREKYLETENPWTYSCKSCIFSIAYPSNRGQARFCFILVAFVAALRLPGLVTCFS